MKIKNFNIPDFGRIFLGKKKEDELLSLDWIVLVFWECDIKSDISVSVDKINKVLGVKEE